MAKAKKSATPAQSKADKARALMAQGNMSAKEVAQKLGTTTQYVYMVAKGAKPPKALHARPKGKAPDADKLALKIGRAVLKMSKGNK